MYRAYCFAYILASFLFANLLRYNISSDNNTNPYLHFHISNKLFRLRWKQLEIDRTPATYVQQPSAGKFVYIIPLYAYHLYIYYLYIMIGRKPYLDIHQRTHTGERFCKICKIWTKSISYKMHIFQWTIVFYSIHLIGRFVAIFAKSVFRSGPRLIFTNESIRVSHSIPTKYYNISLYIFRYCSLLRRFINRAMFPNFFFFFGFLEKFVVVFFQLIWTSVVYTVVDALFSGALLACALCGSIATKKKPTSPKM